MLPYTRSLIMELGMMDSRRRGVKEFAVRIVKETSSVKECVPHREGSAKPTLWVALLRIMRNAELRGT